MSMNVFVIKRFLAVFICIWFTVITPVESQIVNYDTAWTFVYNGGMTTEGRVIEDDFRDVKVLPDGGCIAVGFTRDSENIGCILLVKLSKNNELLWKKTYARAEGGGIAIAGNGELIIGGNRENAPFILRTDSLGNVKWSTWYYDSIKDNDLLYQTATINSIIETSRGQIVCAAGDPFPDISSSPLNNYAAYLEFDSLGRKKRVRQWDNEVGSKISGFHIEETNTGNFLFSGNQSVFYLDSTGMAKWNASYTFMLDGVGFEINNISRAKQLRDGTLMAAGQAYEGGCWTSYQKLYYDAWWSPIDQGGGANTTWDTAGWQGGDDKIYDFTQLKDGKLAFVGSRSNVTDSGGIWTFVTDSTGKEFLWAKQTKIVYKTDKGKILTPLSICATPDGGFTIAGRSWGSAENGGNNGFIAHFIPAPITAAVNTPPQISQCKQIYSLVNGSKVVFTVANTSTSMPEITIFNASGKTVARLSHESSGQGRKLLVWDSLRFGRGVYFYQAKVNGRLFTGSTIAGMR